MPRRHSETGKQAVGHAQKAVEALDLRKLGLSYRKIAEQMGLPGPSSAFALVDGELQALRDAARDKAEAVLDLELERTELLWRSCMQRAATGDPKVIQAAVAVLKRRAAMLGLDSPVRLETTGKLYTVAAASPECEEWSTPQGQGAEGANDGKDEEAGGGAAGDL
jgi:hypothetical protein